MNMAADVVCALGTYRKRIRGMCKTVGLASMWTDRQWCRTILNYDHPDHGRTTETHGRSYGNRRTSHD